MVVVVVIVPAAPVVFAFRPLLLDRSDETGGVIHVRWVDVPGWTRTGT